MRVTSPRQPAVTAQQPSAIPSTSGWNHMTTPALPAVTSLKFSGWKKRRNSIFSPNVSYTQRFPAVAFGSNTSLTTSDGHSVVGVAPSGIKFAWTSADRGIGNEIATCSCSTTALACPAAQAPVSVLPTGSVSVKPVFPSLPSFPSPPSLPAFASLPSLPSAPSFPVPPCAPAGPAGPWGPAGPAAPFTPLAPFAPFSALRTLGLSCLVDLIR